MLLTALLVSAGGCGRSTDLAQYGKFQAAQAAFDTAETTDDFRRVAAMYQEILDSGIVSGAVLYNQGNAFMRAKMRGRAVASYRRAGRYRPRDPYLDANLRSAFGGQLVEPTRPLIEYVLFWQNWISYPGKFRLSTWSASLTFALAICGVWWRQVWLRRITAALLVLTMVLVFSATYDWFRFTYIRHGVVVADEVLARKGNAESYEPAFNQSLGETTEFTVVEERGDWILARLGKEKEGWIPREAVALF